MVPAPNESSAHEGREDGADEGGCPRGPHTGTERNAHCVKATGEEEALSWCLPPCVELVALLG